MAQTYMSSLVFVGGEFPLAMFDERALFDSHLDTDQLKAGPIGQFSYSSGLYRFNVSPGRIDLICQNTDILPQAVVDSAKIIAEVIEPARGAVRVSGVGMNCDTVFNQQYCGMKGASFCSRMFDPRIADLVGASPIDTRAGARFRKDEVLYDRHSDADRESLKQEVYALLKQAGAENWDGEGALALAPGTVDIAQQLIDGFPGYIARPDVAATPHGEVDFDWVIAQDVMVTVSVGPSGEIAFSGMFRGARLNGSESWTGKLPQFVRCCFERLRSSQAE